MNWILFGFVISSLMTLLHITMICMKLFVITIRNLPLVKKNQPNFTGVYVGIFLTALFAALMW
jgi:hypothetical protein